MLRASRLDGSGVRVAMIVHAALPFVFAEADVRVEEATHLVCVVAPNGSGFALSCP
jgi:hypothetical protein